MLNALPGDDSQIYLGVPVVASRPIHVNRLVDKVQAKLNSWSSKMLSQAGKVTLIKYVVEPMVLYGVAGGAFTCYHCTKAESDDQSFPLGLQWQKENAVASKEHEEQLWVKVLRAKYLSRRTLWTAANGSAGTKLWKALIAMRQILKPNLVWQVGKGDKCHVFGKPWHEFWHRYTTQKSYQRRMLLHELIDNSLNTWRTQELVSCFGFHGALYIACKYPTPPISADKSDRLIFQPAHNGKFSLNTDDQTDKRTLKAIWHSKGMIPRVRLFLWRLFHDSVPTMGTYASKMGRKMQPCQLCDNGDDSGVHALSKCPPSRSYWLASQLGLQSDALPNNPKELLHFFTVALQGDMFVSFANHLWALWKLRCGKIHDGRSFNVFSVLHMASYYDALSSTMTRHSVSAPLSTTDGLEGLDADHEGIQCWVDGSYDQHGQGRWAYVLHDNNSLIIYGADSRKISSPFHGELNAILLALRVIKHEGLKECRFYSDCQLLCRLLNGEALIDDVPWQCFFQVQDAVKVFKANSYICVYCPRRLNVEAHCLANHARKNRIEFQGTTYPLLCVTECN
ncbi:hypothetical protein LUZ63_014853 [Rhynchospora breviuscula]|uniref:RNase H type-1 domain-containing protein n=1 Tax=Rhynchospora breviuscula TaxID=2022672 RepID=A0A9Q0CB91_9POAL|nr:hypothetical protein LUZ63_014853 [Rhynchospora breviuscula]